MILPNDFIQKVKEANNIVAVASRYMPLKQKGRDWWACCPFHHEKTPSFAIKEQEQFYKCFGCGVSGNVITLVMHLENTDFLGAVELLAKWANIKMPEVSANPQQIAEQKKKQRILEILDEARKFYMGMLTTPVEMGHPHFTNNEGALKYLHGRGITDELIAKFNIGLSPDFVSILSYLRKKGYTDNELVDAGVAAKSPKGTIYDAMAERITFSIFDLYGNCIGFTGRILPEKDNGEMAKYRNTAQTMVFDKGRICYGADVMKQYLRTNKPTDLIVVEGNVDCISLVAAGFNCTVACMGTAMTPFHAKAFKRFGDQIYLCFDGDNAGKKAALRAVDILAEENLYVRVITLPDNIDPDSFIRANGKEAFQDLMKFAKPAAEYKVEALRTLGVWEEKIQKTLNSPVAEKKTDPLRVSGDNVTRTKEASADTAYTRAINFVAASKLYKKPYAVAPLEFQLPELYDDLITNPSIKKVGDVIDVFPPEEYKEVEHLVTYDFALSEEHLAKQYADSIDYILKLKLREKRDELQKLFEKTQDMEIAREISELNRRIKCR